ncbi:hypothetical protein HPB51_015510 [Rhipicephalus microplus]|uniref:S1 motif domain-containing protein n=1 Tax=Rhipicephalus microplus TaxID=6941 RepID=A0A9J6DH60_RHIMP|nr:hypothetical protein HPB51_015510 [Rhipicephalus microplus]
MCPIRRHETQIGLSSCVRQADGLPNVEGQPVGKGRAGVYWGWKAKSPGILLTATKSASAAKLERRAAVDGTPEICDKKYDLYAKFSKDVRAVQPHQVLAINRGESHKVLTVKLVLPPQLEPGLKNFCESCLRNMGVKMQGQTMQLVRDSIEDAYTRLLEPHLFRSIRSQLTKEAEKESVSVFRSNLRQLLLMPPVRGHAVLGIDPGFKHGCKLAAVSANGSLLQHAVISPHNGNKVQAANVLRQMVLTHNRLGEEADAKCRQCEVEEKMKKMMVAQSELLIRIAKLETALATEQEKTRPMGERLKSVEEALAKLNKEAAYGENSREPATRTVEKEEQASLEKTGLAGSTVARPSFSEILLLERSGFLQAFHALNAMRSCDLVALGNGTACRETEAFLSELISKGCFEPIKLKYCTVEESGVSIYSVTKDAEAELPGLDPNIRSAGAAAGSCESHVFEEKKEREKGVKHDVTESLLKSALEGVVVECVSFVGVDINVCPELTLRKVSGLNAGTARNIVEWRTTNGPFRNRQQLLNVKRLGSKAFEQCAGFVKVFPQTASGAKPAGESTGQKKTTQPTKAAKGSSKDDSFNPLDMTVIHPESYTLAEIFISHLGLDKEAIGKPQFIEKVRQETAKYGVNHFVNLLGGSIATMQLIVDALQHSVEYDIRSEQHQPLFKSGVLSLDEVHAGLELTGKVKNCTNFGAFVDIGVGTDGLIHVSQMNGQTIALGDRVTVRVLNIERSRGRIGLRLLSKG